MGIFHLAALIGLLFYLDQPDAPPATGEAGGHPGSGQESAGMFSLAPTGPAGMLGLASAKPVEVLNLASTKPALQDKDAAVDVPPPCRVLILLEGEYLSHTLERWVRACLDRSVVWAVGDPDTHLDYELTGTRRVALAQGFASLQEHLARYWSIRVLEDETRVIFDDGIQE